MRNVLDPLVQTLEQGQPVVLGTVVRNDGSAPRTSGAHMVVFSDGTLYGSVGGGALEAACQVKAAELFTNGQSYAELKFELNARSAADAGMLCGGTVSVLLQRFRSDSLPLFKQLSKTATDGKPPTVVTILPGVDTPPQILILEEQGHHEIPPDLRQDLLRKKHRVPSLITYNDLEVFVETLLHPGTVHLVGAGHVALATAQCAAFAGFEIVVMDDRQEFANQERFPQAKEVCVLESFDGCIKDLGPDDYVVIVTRGHLHDRDVLAQALHTEAGYVGMIGSTRKREAVYNELRKEGITDADLARVHSPVGLSIGADTPEEIAISIVAQLVQFRAGKTG